MKALFIELPFFENRRSDYLDDDEYRKLQNELLKAPTKGKLVQGTGGLRKIRWTDIKHHKGKRGGSRIIYYFCVTGQQFWMFTIYAKGEVADLTKDQKKALKKMLEREVARRNTKGNKL